MHSGTRAIALDQPYARASATLPAATSAAAVAAARDARSTLDARSTVRTLAACFVVLAGLALLVAASFASSSPGGAAPNPHRAAASGRSARPAVRLGSPNFRRPAEIAADVLPPPVALLAAGALATTRRWPAACSSA